ncbi:unnamed protein product [Phyllotreta striolata]|uniref:Uncharacterized protein n=1 Tax=Phyllotreta striolata TaxID=444603 RepID=A0A9N9TT78_PHYSR|nr:unnamed protein product [Phyllotreta striolata]
MVDNSCNTCTLVGMGLNLDHTKSAGKLYPYNLPWSNKRLWTRIWDSIYFFRLNKFHFHYTPCT